MSIIEITILLFGGMLLVLLTGLPITFALGGWCMIVGLFLYGPRVFPLALHGTESIMGYEALMAVPMFVFMGMMLYYSHIADDVYTTFHNWLTPVPGGLACATVGTSTLIAAIEGSETTATLCMGTIALPLMRKRGYSKTLATGCIQAGAALGFLIPPSIIAILYAIIARESIGRLFAGGVLPGLLLFVMFVIYIIVRCKLQPHLAPPVPKEERPSMQEKLKSLSHLVLPAGIIAAVIGTILLRIVTPVEASAIGAMASLVAVFIKRRLKWQVINEALMTTLKLTSMTMWIFMSALTFGRLYNLLGAKTIVEAVVLNLPLEPIGILLLMQLSFFIMGTCLDDTAILFITMPIYIPIIQELGFDPVWFGVLYLVNMQMAYLTPPFGYCLFLMKSVAPPDITMGDIYRSIIPFLIIQGIGLLLIMLYPQIVLWLHNLLFD